MTEIRNFFLTQKLRYSAGLSNMNSFWYHNTCKKMGTVKEGMLICKYIPYWICTRPRLDMNWVTEFPGFQLPRTLLAHFSRDTLADLLPARHDYILRNMGLDRAPVLYT
jgi:hypothetical protein